MQLDEKKSENFRDFFCKLATNNQIFFYQTFHHFFMTFLKKSIILKQLMEKNEN